VAELASFTITGSTTAGIGSVVLEHWVKENPNTANKTNIGKLICLFMVKFFKALIKCFCSEYGTKIENAA
jgi:hypothetical protein